MTAWHYIFAKPAVRSNNINDLRPAPGSQVLKISLTLRANETAACEAKSVDSESLVRIRHAILPASDTDQTKIDDARPLI